MTPINNPRPNPLGPLPPAQEEKVHLLPSATFTRRKRPLRVVFSKKAILVAVACLSGVWLYSVFARYSAGAMQKHSIFGSPPHTQPPLPNAAQRPSQTEPLLAYGLEEDEDRPTPNFAIIPPSNPLPFRYPPPSERRRVEAIEAYEPLIATFYGLEEWIAWGRLAKDLRWSHDHCARQHDLLISWVNGTDWEHGRALDHYTHDHVGSIVEWWPPKQAPDFSTKLSFRSVSPDARHNAEHPSRNYRRGLPTHDVGENRFREIGELRYSIRSGVQHLRGLDTTHVISPAFFPPRPYDMPTSMWRGTPSRAPSNWTAPSKKHSLITTEDGRVQWGQVPDWLNLTHPRVSQGSENFAAKHRSGGLVLHHDWSIFTPNWLFNHTLAEASGDGFTPTTLLLWKQQVLPTFNSIAVESMLGFEGMQGLQETFVYANDDMFFTSALSLADFATPLLGPVLRLDPSVLVRGRRLPDQTSSGEWPNLLHSAWLLDRRFGARNRAYTVHEPRSFNAKLLREMRMMWAHEWRRSGEDRFRFPSVERPGTSTHFMFSHFVIERFREALLWIYITLKLDGDGDGVVDFDELRELFTPLGIRMPTHSLQEMSSVDLTSTAIVRMPYRSMLENDSHRLLLNSLQLPQPLQTDYQFVSMDGGYPFMTLHPFVQNKAPPRPAGGGRESGIHQVGTEFYPRYHPRDGKTRETDGRFRQGGLPACRINVPMCLSGFQGKSVHADQLFRRFAFENGQECGDCLIVHLLYLSGKRGLSAFLPNPGRLFPARGYAEEGNFPAPGEKFEPHLPVTPVFDTTRAVSKGLSGDQDDPEVSSPHLIDRPDFRASAVALALGWSGASKREFAMRLLQRYNYVLGSAPSIFYRMEQEASTERFLQELIQESNDAGDFSGGSAKAPTSTKAFLCLNDDYGAVVKPQMRKLFERWAKVAFPKALPWEDRVD